MIELLLVGGGASLGALSRYVISQLGRMYHTQFPWPTFVINLSGAFLIGWLAGSQLSHLAALLLMTGFCGGYTTFSTFNTELLILVRDHHWWAVGLYFGGSVVLGLLAVSAGLWLALRR